MTADYFMRRHLLEVWFAGSLAHSFTELSAAFMRSAWPGGARSGYDGASAVALYVSLRDTVADLIREGHLCWTTDGALTAVWSNQ